MNSGHHPDPDTNRPGEPDLGESFDAHDSPSRPQHTQAWRSTSTMRPTTHAPTGR